MRFRLVNLRTVSIADAALDLDRPDGSTGRFYHVRTTPARISSHVTHVMFVAQRETKCVCVSSEGLVGSLSRLRAVITSAEIDIITGRAHGDRHEGGQPSAG